MEFAITKVDLKQFLREGSGIMNKAIEIDLCDLLSG
jgi:hypothetical protein